MSIGKSIGAGIAALFAIIALVVGLMAVTGTLSYLTAPFRGAVEAQEITQGGQYRIAAYEEFYERCASIQADEDRLKNLTVEKEAASDARVSQIDATLTAVANSRANKIREYNSASNQEATRGQFRDSGLPFEIDVEGETSCSV